MSDLDRALEGMNHTATKAEHDAAFRARYGSHGAVLKHIGFDDLLEDFWRRKPRPSRTAYWLEGYGAAYLFDDIEYDVQEARETFQEAIKWMPGGLGRKEKAAYRERAEATLHGKLKQLQAVRNDGQACEIIGFTISYGESDEHIKLMYNSTLAAASHYEMYGPHIFKRDTLVDALAAHLRRG